MLRKRNVHGRPNSPMAQRSNIIQSLLVPYVLNSDKEYFNLAIIQLEVAHILNIVILCYSPELIGERGGQRPDGGRFHSSLRRTFDDGGN